MGVEIGGTPATPGAPTTSTDSGRVELSANAPTGIFTNIFRDAKDIASGLWKLGGVVTTDARNAVGDLADLHPGEADYQLDDMFNAVFGLGQFQGQGSAVWNDYQDRYGGNGRNGLGGWAADTGGNIYEHPLSFISDALTVATAGGWGAAKAASLAGKAAEAATVAGDAAKAAELATVASDATSAAQKAGVIAQGADAATAASELSALSGVADQASNVATVGGAATEAARASAVDKFVHAVQGTTKYIFNPKTGKVEPVAAAYNPARRLLYQNQYMKLTSRSTPWLEARAQKMAELADKAGPGATKYLVKQQKYRELADAAIRTGADRVYNSGFAASKARKWVDLAVSQATGKATKLPDTIDQAYKDAYGSIPPEVATGENIVDSAQGVDTSLTSDGIVAPQGRGLRRAEVFDEQGVATRSDGPVRWQDGGVPKAENIPNEGNTFWSDKHIDERLLPDAAGLKPVQDLGEGVTEVTPGGMMEGMARAFVVRDSSGEVVGMLGVQKGGALSVAVKSTARRQGYATKLYSEAEKAGVDIAKGTGKKTSSTGKALSDAWLAGRRGDATPNEGGSRLPAKDSTDTTARAAYDAAVETAKQDTRELTPKLRQEFGSDAKVTAGKVKGEQSTRTKAELLGGNWRDVEDISRFRITAEDMFTDPVKQQNALDRIEKVTGGRIRKVENSVNNPMPDGSRGIRVVVEMPDGHPVEFQLLDPMAAKVVDATTHTRNLVRTLTATLNRGKNIEDAGLRLEKLNRLQQQLWEGVTDNLRVARGGPAPAEMRRAHNAFRVETYGKMTDKLLGSGALDVHSAFDNAFLPMRYKGGAHFDEKAGQMVGGPSPLQLDDALAHSGEMAPMYYPLMDPEQIPKRGDFLRKGVTMGNQVADQNLKKNTGRLLSEARYEKADPARVWRIRAAQSARMQEHIDLIMNTVQEYGHPLKKGELPGPNEEYFAPGLVKQLAAQHNMMLDALANNPDGKGLRDLLDSLSGENAKRVVDLMNSGDMEAWAIPKVVADRMRKHAGMKLGENVDILFGTPTKLWKTAVLAGRPAWMVNNLFSNIIFLKLQGGKLTDVLRQVDKRYVDKVREAIGPEALDRVEGGLYSASKSGPRRYDTETTLGKAADLMQAKAAQGRVGTGLAKYADWVQGLNSSMEDAFRRASYMTAADRAVARGNINTLGRRFWQSKQRLEQTFAAGVDEKSWHTAVDELNKYLNDYGTASPLEKNILRPYIMPFMAFYKHAAKLLLTMPFDHPAKSRLFQLIQEADNERMQQAGLDPNNLPGWLTGDMLLTNKGEGGDYRFVSGGGLNPFNAVLGNPLNTMHPAFKMIYEQSTGRSAFTGKQFTDPNVVTNFGSDQQYRIDPNTGQATQVEHVAPGLLEHLLQQIPQYEMTKDIIAGGQTYDTSTLLDVIMHPDQNVVRDKDGNILKPTDALAQLGKLFGYSKTDLNAADMADKTIQAKADALKLWLARQQAAGASQTPPPLPTGGGGVELGS